MIADTKAALHAAKTLARVNDVYRRSMKTVGFTSYAVGYVPAASSGADILRTSPFLLLNWPKRWLEVYAREGFAADDILLSEAARTSEPFTWSEVRTRHPDASARTFALAAEFGWTDGFVIPVHNELAPPSERFGVVSLAAPALGHWGTPRRDATVVLSLTAFARARFFAASNGQAVSVTLSEREREALAFVAEGLGDAEIAAAMKIKPATAHFHVEKAKKKLDAVTRAQAVAVALTTGLI